MPFTFTTTFAPNPAHPGTTHSLPFLLLRLEGATLFFSSVYLYHRLRRFYLAKPSPPTSTTTTHLSGDKSSQTAAARGLSWTRFAALLLLPDLGMVGFLHDSRWGSWIYNIAHWEVLPSLLVVSLLAGALSGASGGGAGAKKKDDDDNDAAVARPSTGSGPGFGFGGIRSVSWAKYMGVGLVWLAHIGMDRMIGAGLKYETGFGHTHLGIM